MVLIKLDEKYSLGSDSLQWILFNEDRALWFYQRLDALLLGYVQLKARGSNAEDIQSLMKYQKELLESVVQLINKHPQLVNDFPGGKGR